jgi:predicted enzyme related to lactoylglutathione lyase
MKISGLAIPVDDLSGSIEFLTAQFGFSLKFRDGDRYAALNFQDMTLALLSGEEKLTDSPAFIVKVDEIDTSIRNLTEGGATVIRPITQGPHELRAVLSSPASITLIITQKNSS